MVLARPFILGRVLSPYYHYYLPRLEREGCCFCVIVALLFFVAQSKKDTIGLICTIPTDKKRSIKLQSKLRFAADQAPI